MRRFAAAYEWAMRAALAFLRAPVFLCMRALLDGLVDARDQGAVLGLDRGGVAALDSALEPPEIGLDRARKEPVLGSLPLAA